MKYSPFRIIDNYSAIFPAAAETMFHKVQHTLLMYLLAEQALTILPAANEKTTETTPAFPVLSLILFLYATFPKLMFWVAAVLLPQPCIRMRLQCPDPLAREHSWTQYNSDMAWLAHLFCLPLCNSLFPEIQNAAVIPQAGSQRLIYVSMMSFFLWAAKQICIDVMFFSTLESQPVGLNATLIIPSRDV